ncbi:MAG: formate/nitrite transporter family protein [Dysosmobacter sp.]|nr:formate/nitrite transporter family protein [Dysosmobacter sp.]
MTCLTPKEFLERYAAAGTAKTQKSAGKLLALAALAGALIALGAAASSTAVHSLDNAGLARTVSGLLFPFGLCMVLVTGAELFTGNSLLLLSLLEKKCSLPGLLRNWVLVYLGNFLGAFLVAAGCVFFGQLGCSGGELAVYVIRLAAGKCALPFLSGFGLGIFCNVLVCLGVLLALSAQDGAGRLMGAFLPVCCFVLCGFEHCVANMYYVSAGLLALQKPQYLQLAQAAGADLGSLTLGNFLLGNLLPVTLGNILGGGGLAALLWYAHLKENG